MTERIGAGTAARQKNLVIEPAEKPTPVARPAVPPMPDLPPRKLEKITGAQPRLPVLEVRPGIQTGATAMLNDDGLALLKSTPAMRALFQKLAEGNAELRIANLTLPRDGEKFLARFPPEKSTTPGIFHQATGLDYGDTLQAIDDIAQSPNINAVLKADGALAKKLNLTDGKDGTYGLNTAAGAVQDIGGTKAVVPHAPRRGVVGSASTNETAQDFGTQETAYTKTLVQGLDDTNGDMLAALERASGFDDAHQVASGSFGGTRTDAPDRKRYALVAAVVDYSELRAKIPGAQAGDLSGTAFDQAALSPALHRNGVDVTQQRDVTAGEFLGAAKALIAKAKPGDDVGIFFSGHGLPDGGLYFKDGSHATPKQMRELVEFARQKGVNVAISADACHSGTFGESMRKVDVERLKGQLAQKSGPAVAESQKMLGVVEQYIDVKRSAMFNHAGVTTSDGRTLALVAASQTPGGFSGQTLKVDTSPLTQFSAAEIAARLDPLRKQIQGGGLNLTQETNLKALREADKIVDVALDHVRRTHALKK